MRPAQWKPKVDALVTSLGQEIFVLEIPTTKNNKMGMVALMEVSVNHPPPPLVVTLYGTKLDRI